MSEQLQSTETKQANDDSHTHFGYQNIKADEKAGKVAEVFHSVANKYDIMNDLMSMGVHRIWKRLTIESSGVRPSHKVLDIAGGTGDLTMQFSKRVGDQGQVILADINASMLNVGRDRLIDKGYGNNIEFVQANAECLPFPDNYFNCISIAFGLRNVTDKDKALASMARVLKPGGRLLILEFSKPSNALISDLYDKYSFTALPLMGKLITNDSESYKYLAESIRMHPDQETLKGMMENAGLANCRFQNMTGGVVALHSGVKP